MAKASINQSLRPGVDWREQFRLELGTPSVNDPDDPKISDACIRLAYLIWRPTIYTTPPDLEKLFLTSGYIEPRANSLEFASDPDTNPTVLAELATHWRGEIREAIAKNPSTPQEHLIVLAADPQLDVRLEVANNASTPADLRADLIARLTKLDDRISNRHLLYNSYMDADQISVLTEMMLKDKHSGYYELSSSTSASSNVLDRISKTEDEIILWNVAQNPSASAETLDRLARIPNYRIQILVARNPSTSAETLARLLELDDSSINEAVSLNPSTPLEILKILTSQGSDKVRHSIAKNPQCPIPFLEELAHTTDLSLLLGVLVNDSAPLSLRIECIRKLPKRDARDTISSLACSSLTPAEILAIIADDNHRNIRRYVADNPATAPSTLIQLSNDDDINVRCRVASHHACPQSVLERLATDPEVSTRSAVGANSQTPSKILGILAHDPDDSVRGSIASNKNTDKQSLAHLSRDTAYYVRPRVAANPNTDCSVLALLVNDDDSYVRKSVAGNASTPVDVLKILSEDSESDVVAAVAENPNTPIELLIEIFQNKEPDIIGALAKNPNTPAPILTEIAKGKHWADLFQNPSLPPNIWSLIAFAPSRVDEEFQTIVDSVILDYAEMSKIRIELIKKIVAPSKPSYARAHTLLLDDCPQSSLTKCVKSKSWLERCAVAMNPNTPEKAIKALLEDDNAFVRAAAAARAT